MKHIFPCSWRKWSVALKVVNNQQKYYRSKDKTWTVFSWNGDLHDLLNRKSITFEQKLVNQIYSFKIVEALDQLLSFWLFKPEQPNAAVNHSLGVVSFQKWLWIDYFVYLREVLRIVELVVKGQKIIELIEG
jgi:hypothetical protein